MASITQPPSWQAETQSFVSRFFGSWKKTDETDPSIMVKPRKAPIKVEPKVFFANERTFLAWMHVSIILAGASIAILAFSDHAPNRPGAELYGVVTLPVAIIFIVYAMYQCTFLPSIILSRLLLSSDNRNITFFFFPQTFAM